MRRVIRENAAWAIAAGALCSTIAWLGLYGYGWNDYEIEAKPAFDALVSGHLGQFLRLAPEYGGSLIERAPFALLPGLWSGGALAVYRFVAIPCLLASAVLALVLLTGMRADRRGLLARGLALALCTANPVTLRALEVGHPEELLGGCLCVLAVLAAHHRRPLLAGALLGLAIANKEWALVAVLPVLLALPAGRRLRCVTCAAVVAAAVLAPLLLAHGSKFTQSTQEVASTAFQIFQPWQVWWFFGHHGALVHGPFDVPKPGYRQAVGWAGRISHPIVVLAAVGVLAPLWLRRTTPHIRQARSRIRRLARALSGPERAVGIEQALLALALVMLLRCVLDTWDTMYYTLPFVLAVLAWEVTRDNRQPPVLSLTVTMLVWASFQWLPESVSPDAQAALFLAWTLPLALGLGTRLYALSGTARARTAVTGADDAPQPTIVSSLGRLVSTPLPFCSTTTRSSIRTPSAPGR